MAQTFIILPPHPLEPEDWQTWIDEWHNFELVMGILSEEENVRVAMFLADIGREANCIYKMFKWDANGDDKKLNKIIKKFLEYCILKKNKIYECYVFNKRQQLEDETVDHYVTKLQHLATTCDFAQITEEQIIQD